MAATEEFNRQGSRGILDSDGQGDGDLTVVPRRKQR